MVWGSMNHEQMKQAQERRDKIKKLHEQGLTAAQIADIIKRKTRRVREDLRSMGLKPHHPRIKEDDPDCFNCPFSDCKWEQHGLCPAQKGQKDAR